MKGGHYIIKFIILTTQRTGSTVFWRYLDTHPSISAHGEMFLKSLKRPDSYATYRKKSFRNHCMHYVSRRQLTEEYMSQFFKSTSEIKAIGFKLMYSQLFPCLEDYLHRKNVHVIHLIRKNVLKIIVSRETAKKRNLYHATPEENIPAVKVYLHPKTLRQDIIRILSEVSHFRERFARYAYLEAYYEDFVSSRVEVSRKIFDFLQVPFIENLDVPLRKINPDSLELLIENYEEIERELRFSQFAEYLV